MTGQLVRTHRSISGEFFTSSYRVTGRVSFGGMGIVSVLTDSTHSTMMIEDAYIALVTQPSTIISHRASIHLPKAALDLMVFGKNDNIGLDVLRGNTVRVTRHKVFIATNTFEVRGQLDTGAGKFDPELFLTNVVSKFVPILNVSANANFLTKAVYSGEVALVNRAHIDLITADE